MFGYLQNVKILLIILKNLTKFSMNEETLVRIYHFCSETQVNSSKVKSTIFCNILHQECFIICSLPIVKSKINPVYLKMKTRLRSFFKYKITAEDLYF